MEQFLKTFTSNKPMPVMQPQDVTDMHAQMMENRMDAAHIPDGKPDNDGSY